MFNYVDVEFPGSSLPPQRVYEFKLSQQRYSHELVSAKFRDWDPKFLSIKPGSPVVCTLRTTGATRVFNGYVQTVTPNLTPGKNFVNMNIIGASYIFKQARQRVFTNTTADKVIETIATDNGFSAVAEPHPRVYQQISQAGHTDLELMTRLAMQCGYSLRFENTSVYFRPPTLEYTKTRSSAERFELKNANNPEGSTIYAFTGILDINSQFQDITKAAYAVNGVDAVSGTYVTHKNLDQPATSRAFSQFEFFDRYATNIVAPSKAAAYYEAATLDSLNKFPYRAIVSVIGSPNLHPDAPVYLSGLGNEYSGYWVVLSAEHIVKEESRNVFKYVTHLEVGTDSLGEALAGDDGVLITEPESVPTRQLEYGLRNVPVNTTSVLSAGSTPVNANSRAALLLKANRKVETNALGEQTLPRWVAQTVRASTRRV